MAFDIAKARQITQETIQFGIRHKDYGKTVEIAKKSHIFVTGEGQDTEYLLNLRDKETDRQKQIRVKVTKPITPFALNPVKTQYEKIWRVDGVIKDITHQDEAAKVLIDEAVRTYHSNASLSHYFERRYIHFQFLDPNAWHITERRNVLEENGLVKKVDVYPFEVSSEQAINYEYDNGVPVWLIVEQKRMEVSRKINGDGKAEVTEEEVSDFYFYAAGLALSYKGYVNELPPEGTEVVTLLMPDGQDAKIFAYREYNTGSEEFPGQKWGSYDDPDGDGTVKVPPFWTGARFILEDLIEKKSVFDVSCHNHVFPKLFCYNYPCKYKPANGDGCVGGYLGGNKEHKCPKCDGKGVALHYSESDVIAFRIPDNASGQPDIANLPPLSNLAYYHQPPLDVTTALYGWINDFREWVYLASFNTTNVEKAVAPRTATEIDRLWDEINTRVYPCANWQSRMYEKAVRVTAQYLEKSNGLTVRHSFPVAMQLEGLDVLIDRRQRAKAAGLSHDVIWKIDCSIIGKTYTEDPQLVADIKAWEGWKPFKSMDSENVALILSNRANDDFDKLLYENWDNVKMAVEALIGEDVHFSKVPKDKQLSLIQKAVETVAEQKFLKIPWQ